MFTFSTNVVTEGTLLWIGLFLLAVVFHQRLSNAIRPWYDKLIQAITNKLRRK